MNADLAAGFPEAQLAKAQIRHAAVLYLGSLAGAACAVAYAVAFGMTKVDVALLVGFYSLTFLGISVGYHRYFSHRSFKVGPRTEVMLAVLGSMSGQGSVFYWAANHRRHHQYSDQPQDVHSPYVNGAETFGMLKGLWFAQIQFGWSHSITNNTLYIRDLLGSARLRAANRLYLPLFWAGMFMPALLGGLGSGTLRGAISGFLFGGVLRLFATLQFTNTINSVTHYFGSRRFHTTDHSRNNAWLAIPTFGESWHNNHHAFPRSAHIGLRWWELDLGALFLTLLVRLGLAWDVVLTPASDLERKRLSKQKLEA